MSFIAESCDNGMLASWAAVLRTSASSTSNGTERLMSPTSAASLPENGLPVSAYSFAFVSPRRYSQNPER